MLSTIVSFGKEVCKSLRKCVEVVNGESFNVENGYSWFYVDFKLSNLTEVSAVAILLVNIIVAKCWKIWKTKRSVFVSFNLKSSTKVKYKSTEFNFFFIITPFIFMPFSFALFDSYILTIC